MATALFKNLDTTTIAQILNFQSTMPVEGKLTKKEAINMIMCDIETAAVKQLSANLKLQELKDAVATLKIDHGANTLTKTVLSKRLKESFEDKGCEKWLETCKDEEVIRHFAAALELKNAEKGAVKTLKTEIAKEMELIGLQVVLNNLTLEVLKDCCDQLSVDNHEHVTTKTALVRALAFNVAIPSPEPKKKKVVKVGKKLPIEDCKNYDQIFQHYGLDDLVAWCKDNDVKSSGSKKILINRILDFLGGDKENTMVNQEVKRKPKKSASGKKPTSKKTDKKKADKEDAEEDDNESEEEKSAEDNEDKMSDDDEAQQKAVAAERKLRTTEKDKKTKDAKEKKQKEKSEEEENDKMSEQEEDGSNMDDDEEAPKSLKGLILCITGKLSAPRKDIESAISKAGGTVASSLTKKVNILICNEDSNSAKFEKARAAGVKIVTEDYLKNIM